MELRAKKSLGQNFLNNQHVPELMCKIGKVSKGDTVLEIGPGTGVLTKALLSTGAKVISLETDERALELLRGIFEKEIREDKLQLIKCDVREISINNLNLLDHKFKVIANIPYYLSGFLFRSILQNESQPSDLVFLVQKEVAKRAAANHMKGEKMSLLSISTQIYGDVKLEKIIKRGNFSPAPKVDSAIISILNINRDKLNQVDEESFFTLLHTGFGHKRKQLLSNLSATYDRNFLESVFTTLNFDRKVRAEDLDVDNWVELAGSLLK
tara:strand:- start:812 stop:1615 length:804 start_codon:yes stop_codon:yes gene_type:complete